MGLYRRSLRRYDGGTIGGGRPWLRRPARSGSPETANARILGEPFQVNHCRTPGYANFGAPSRTKRGKTGPSKDRDLRYKVKSAAITGDNGATITMEMM